MISFFVYGNPVAQGRPRFARVGKGVRTYDPAKSRNWKQDVKWQAIENKVKLMDGPLELRLVFYLLRPKGHYGKRGLRPSAPAHHTKKPDVDNMVKGVKDGLKGICYRDDSQIVRLEAIKEYGEQPGVKVAISEAEPPGTPAR